MKEENRVLGSYSSITDAALDTLIISIKRDHPNDGEVMVAGHLCRIGVRVTRARMRASIHRVDPLGIAERSRRIIRRRIYSAPHPNYVWHIDSHHKLIRWRMVIHGAIDGFSRKILYLTCANNNRASTVISFFSSAVGSHGLPDRIRSDKGGENTAVWRYMLHYHHMDPTCIIAGPSTHNERIERLWYDVFRCVGQIFYSMLYSLEEEELLDPLNDIDLYCVHFAVLPEINHCLKGFMASWNHHSISTEHNMTPEQLFTIGMLHQLSAASRNAPNSTSSDFGSINLGAYNMQDTSIVDIPTTPNFVCPMLSNALGASRSQISTSDFGKSSYINAIHAVGNHIQSGCDQCFVS